MRLHQAIGIVLGDSLKEAMTEGFDAELAHQSLCYFEAGAIPRPPGEMPPEVSNVRFSANLDRVEPLTTSAVRRAGQLFEALVPASTRPRGKRTRTGSTRRAGSHRAH
jgi:hypothetical protein